MCIICTELQNKNVSPWEAKRNLIEMSGSLSREHYFEVLEKISVAHDEKIDYEFAKWVQFRKKKEKAPSLS